MIGTFRKFQKAIPLYGQTWADLESGALQVPRGQYFRSPYGDGQVYRYNGLALLDSPPGLVVQMATPTQFRRYRGEDTQARHREALAWVSRPEPAPKLDIRSAASWRGWMELEKSGAFKAAAPRPEVKVTPRKFTAEERSCLRPTWLYLVAQVACAWVA